MSDTIEIHKLERICDWVGVMDRGRLNAERPMQSFKNSMCRNRSRVRGSPVGFAGGDQGNAIVTIETRHPTPDTYCSSVDCMATPSPPLPSYRPPAIHPLNNVSSLLNHTTQNQILAAASTNSEM